MRASRSAVVRHRLAAVLVPVFLAGAAAGVGGRPARWAVAGAASDGAREIFLPALLSSAGFYAGTPPTPTQPLPSATPSASATPAAPGRLVLNEVAIGPDDPTWIELRNVGPGTASPASVRLTRSMTDTYELPAALAPLPAGGLLLVAFDGQATVSGNTVHADRIGFTDAAGDEVLLTTGDGARLDRVAWGAGRKEPVPLGPGGYIPAIGSGATIGRTPGYDGPRATGWVRYVKDDATPGQPNAAPAPEAFPMVDGLVTDQATPNLEWYPVPGAVAYRVQLAADEMFSPLIAEGTVTATTFTTPLLQPGAYVWRLQTIGGGGALSRFSDALHLTVSSGDLLPLAADGPAPSPARPAKKAVLDVPMIKQHKDTGMLLLEEPNDQGAHAWDVAHPDLDKGDPADNMNCGLASTAMVNAFYGGTISQDRLGYEIRKDDQPGPEGDLNYGEGITDDQFVQLLEFALGGGVEAYGWLGIPGERDAFWENVTLTIDDGEPVPMCGGGHCVVITGYSDNLLGRRLAVNDPWVGPRVLDLENVPVSVYAFPPPTADARDDEPTIGSDGDGDGVVDFDETERFGTDPADDDSDQDQLPDKADIHLSVFDPDDGYVNFGPARDDIDGDSLPPERDEDSDNGGCIDGLEDLNHDGRLDKAAQETSPYRKEDDKCISGWWHLSADVTAPFEGGVSRSWSEEWSRFSLRPVAAGKLEGHARLSIYIGAHVEYTDAPCPVVDEPTSGVEWQSDLTGTWTGQDVVVDAAVKSPSWTVTAISCGIVTTTQADGAVWGGTGGTLKDGVFEEHVDLPVGDGNSGHSTIDIHIEQSKGGAVAQ